MTSELILYIAAGVLLAAAISILLRGPRALRPANFAGPPAPAEFFPVHCRNFAQVRHALSFEDAPYLASHASPPVYRRWRKSIRRAGRIYLASLREDFSRLNHLARLLSLYSPQVKLKQEIEILGLNMYFQFLYGIVLARFLLGRPAEDRLEQMASLIGSLGSRLEQAALPPEISAGALTP